MDQTVWRCQHGRAIAISDRQPSAPHGPCCPWKGTEQCVLSATGERGSWDDSEDGVVSDRPSPTDLRIVARFL